MHTHNHDGTTMTVEDAARRLGIGRSLAYELARRGELPGVLRLGRTFRVSRQRLERALGGAIETDQSPESPEAA